MIIFKIILTSLFARYLSAAVIERNNFIPKKIQCFDDNSQTNRVLTCNVANIRGKKPEINVVIRLLKQIEASNFTLKVYQIFKNSELFMFTMKADSCKALNGTKLNSFLKPIRNLIMSKSNLNTSCPIYPGIIFIQNFSLTDAFLRLLPSVFPKSMYKFTLDFVGRFLNVKLVKKYLSFEFFFSND